MKRVIDLLLSGISSRYAWDFFAQLDHIFVLMGSGFYYHSACLLPITKALRTQPTCASPRKDDLVQVFLKLNFLISRGIARREVDKETVSLHIAQLL